MFSQVVFTGFLVFFAVSQATVRDSFPVEPSLRQCSCGVKTTNRIVGGTFAAPNEFPWQIALVDNNVPYCGASLLDPNWAITAAKCVYNKTSFNLVMGFTDFNNSVNAFTTTAAAIKVHPGYKPAASSVNDSIALIRLASPAPLSSSISPICLPYKYPLADFAGQNVTVTGWGGTTKIGTQPSSQLKKATMTVLTKAKCTAWPYLWHPYFITDKLMCLFLQGQDTCNGDDGGSVNWVDTTSSRTYLIGIRTYGHRCALRRYPSVYISVNDYLAWIGATTGQSFCNV